MYLGPALGKVRNPNPPSVPSTLWQGWLKSLPIIRIWEAVPNRAWNGLAAPSIRNVSTFNAIVNLLRPGP
jgi:hypothetical protein